MPILIDGHNLIGRLSTLSLQDPDDEEELVRWLRSYRARTGQSITAVFDPGGAFTLPQVLSVGGVEVVFAPQGSSADTVIIRRVRQDHEPRRWLVVTSDQRLAGTVMGYGARVQSAEAFAAELEGPVDAPPEWRERALSPDEVEAWLTLFQSPD